jgi:hypothetical protein
MIRKPSKSWSFTSWCLLSFQANFSGANCFPIWMSNQHFNLQYTPPPTSTIEPWKSLRANIEMKIIVNVRISGVQNYTSKLHYIPYIDIHWLSFVSVSLCGVSGFLRRSLIVVVLFKRRPQGLRSVEDVGTSGEMSWRSRYFQQLRIKPKILETSRSLALITAYKPLTLDLCKLKLSQGLCLFLGKTHIHNLLYLAPLWHVSTYHET